VLDFRLDEQLRVVARDGLLRHAEFHVAEERARIPSRGTSDGESPRETALPRRR
jgi:hypothetical protein